jgi:queuine/archaeosine tRNA-ribosyltransferase
MKGVTRTDTASVETVTDLAWKMVATANFNNVGHPDILWRNTATGVNSFWCMDGITPISYAVLDSLTDQSMEVVGQGNYN